MTLIERLKLAKNPQIPEHAKFAAECAKFIMQIENWYSEGIRDGLIRIEKTEMEMEDNHAFSQTQIPTASALLLTLLPIEYRTTIVFQPWGLSSRLPKIWGLMKLYPVTSLSKEYWLGISDNNEWFDIGDKIVSSVQSASQVVFRPLTLIVLDEIINRFMPVSTKDVQA